MTWELSHLSVVIKDREQIRALGYNSKVRFTRVATAEGLRELIVHLFPKADLATLPTSTLTPNPVSYPTATPTGAPTPTPTPTPAPTPALASIFNQPSTQPATEPAIHPPPTPVPFNQLYEPISDVVAYVAAHASTTKSSPTTIFSNMLSILDGAPTTMAGPQTLPQNISLLLQNIHDGSLGFEMKSPVVRHHVTGRTLAYNEVRLLDVYGTGDCGFCAPLTCAYPNEFATPLEHATAISCVLSYALHRSANLPALQSSALRYITREQVLHVGAMLGLHTTILEVAEGRMKPTISTLPDRPMNAKALIYFGNFNSAYNSSLEANHFFPVQLVGAAETVCIVPAIFTPRKHRTSTPTLTPT